MTNAIEVRGLCKEYGDFRLDRVDLTVPCGAIVGLIGENGAGKSTTLRAILNLIRPDGGTVKVFGRAVSEAEPDFKEDIGVVLDEASFHDPLKAPQVGRILSGAYRNWDQRCFDGYLDKFGLPRDKKIKDFSKGMRMKLSIATALSHHPRLLILDEATSGLDPVVRDEVMDIFNEFTRDENHAILISSHIVSDLEKICDYIAFLHKGKLILCEEKDRLKEEYGVLHCTAQDAAAIPASAIVGKRMSPLGCELLVKRSGVPGNPTFSPVDIEQLFIFMAKEEH